MADLGKLWFELGIKGDVAKDLQKYIDLFGDVDKSIQNISKGFDKNANDALSAFNRISEARRSLNKVYDQASESERKKMDESLKQLDKFEAGLVQIIRDAQKMGSKGLVSDFLREEHFAPIIQSIRNYTTSLASAQKETQRFATNAERLKGTIRNVKEKLDSLRTIRSSGILNSQDFMASVRVIGELKNALQELRNAEIAGNVSSSELATIRAKATNAMQKATQIEKQYGNVVQTNKNVVKEYANAFDQLAKSTQQTNRYLSEIKNQIAATFSIYAIEGFAKSLITIGGEFEKQHIALKSMLGDAQQANEIFSQIKSLAPISPFTFRELTTYAKQLTAFNIPFEELYDTTKRLSDISAGLGVDMGRIILAYGQVRSASVLRGQELRQFTEAGIPIVQALADKLTKMNGTLVTTGEVFDYISKRKVPFEMVKEILWDLTDESGRFYNMQMVLSDTLAGKWANLQDSWEIMLSSLANSQSIMGGYLKEGVVMVTNLINALKTLSPMLATGFIGAFSGSLLSKGAKGITGNTSALKKQILETKGLVADQIQLNVLTSQQTDLQKRILSTKKLITAEDLAILQSEGKISSSKMVQLAEAEKITYEEMKRNLIAQGYTAEQAKQILNANILGDSLSKIGNFLKNNWFTIALTLAATAFGYFTNKAREASNKASEAADSAAQRFGNLKQVLESSMSGAPESAEGLKVKINEIEQALEGVDPYLEKFKEVHKNDDTKTYFEALRKELELTTDAYKKATEAKGLFEKLNDHSPLEDSVGKNFSDWTNSVAETNASLSKAGTSVRETLMEAIRELSKTDNVFLASLHKEDGKERSLVDVLRRLLEGDRNNERLGKIVGLVRGTDAHQALLGFFESLKGEAGDLLTVREQIRPEMERIKNYILTTESEIVEGSEEYSSMFMRLFNIWLTSLGQNAEDAAVVYKDMLKEFNVNSFYSSVLNNNKTNNNNNNNNNNNGRGSTDEQLKKWKEDFNELKKFYSQYKKWANDIGKDAAIERLRNSGIFASMFNAAGKPIYNIDDWKDTLKQFKETIAGGSSERNKFKIEVGLELDTVEYDEMHEKLEEAGKRISEYLSDEVAKYNLYQKIFEKTGDKDFAMKAFADGRVWDDVSKSMAEKLAQMLGTEVSKIDFDADSITAEKALKETNGAYEIWKKIVEITKGNYTKAIENAADATNKLLTTEEKVAILEKQIEDWRNDSSGLDHSAEIEKTQREINELKSSLFSTLPVYDQIFGDTAYRSIASINEGIRQMNEIITNAKESPDKKHITSSYIDSDGVKRDVTLTIAEFRRLREQGDKLFNAWKDKNPFSGLLQSWKSLKKVLNDPDAKPEDKAKEWAKFAATLGSCADVVGGLAGNFKEMFNALGNDSMADAMDNVQAGMNSISNIGKGFAQGGIFGAAIAAAGELAGWIGRIAGAHDKKLDKAIQKSQLEVKKLENSYKNLEDSINRAMGGIYNIRVDDSALIQLQDKLKKSDFKKSLMGEWKEVLYGGITELSKATEKAIRNALQSESNYDAMLANLYVQRDELRRQMELEDEKKKTNKEKMEDYKQQLKELDVQIKDFAQDLAKSLYDIDVKSWAKELTDAVVSAWAKGEDAAEAFHDKVRDIVQDLTKNILTQKIMEQALQPVLDNIIQEMDNKKGQLDQTSIIRFAEALDLAVNSAVPTIENILEQLKSQGWDFSESANESSGLSKSISGMSEDTGNLVASYLNATRADVSVIRSILESAYGAGESSIAKAQLYQLESIASYTSRNAEAAERIEKMFRSVTEGSNKVYVR